MADVKISALTAASALTGTEVLPVVQSGTTKKSTVALILAAPGPIYTDQTPSGTTVAGYQNSGAYVVAHGANAGYQNTGAQLTAMGQAAAYGNTGANVSAFGEGAGVNNNVALCSMFGTYAGHTNTGSESTFCGAQSGVTNTQTRSTFLGTYAGWHNTGAKATVGGAYTGYGNTGAQLTAFGYIAAYNNTGANVTAIGAFTTAAGFNSVVLLGEGATATAANQFVIGSASYPQQKWIPGHDPDTYLETATADTWKVYAGGQKVLEINETGGAPYLGFFGTTAVARKTGYTTFTNLSTDRTCDANATSVDELADIVGTLIEDLKAYGLLAA